MLKMVWAVCASLLPDILQAQPYISIDTPPSCYEIEGRVRNGRNAYEGALFTPSTPGPLDPGGAKWKMDPAGKPVWNTNGNHYGDVHSFTFIYTPVNATSVWSIDFNRDGDFSDARETISNVAPTHIGKGFQYINVFGQGYEGTTIASLYQFTINGMNFGTLSSSSNTPFSVLFEDSSGLFKDIVITGEFSFSASTLSERPRIWVQLGDSNFGPPTCALTNPLDGTFYAPESTINLAATAIDYLGKVIKVEFYDGDSKIGEDLTSPYAFQYIHCPSGIRTLRAKAIDNHQAMTYSNSVSVLVNAAPVSAILTPADGARFYDPDTIIVEASVIDANDTTNQVEFFLDDESLGINNHPPYVIHLLNIPIGPHTLHVKSSDQYGATSISQVIHFIARCIREDVNNDGVVSSYDFLDVLTTFGSDCQGCPTDFNNDGRVDTFDYLRVLARFGYSCN
jgi:hypothetical protein